MLAIYMHCQYTGYENKTRAFFAQWQSDFPFPNGVEFVVRSCIAPRVFSGYVGFPPSTKSIIPKFQFDLDRAPGRKADLASPFYYYYIFLVIDGSGVDRRHSNSRAQPR